MPPPNSFYEILTRAINDFVIFGYDSEERLRYWIEQLSLAISREVASEAEMQQRLIDTLQMIWDRAVDRGGILKDHPGVPLWTVERLKPHLRDELHRRIAASADLIKVNRQEAVAQTLRRFSGWASSVPPGGAAEVDRVALKGDVRKPLAQLSYSQRRVAIDQGQKMLANVSDIVAQDAGAIAAQWHSRWRVPGYQARPEHKERDKHWYLIRDSWAQQKGLVKPIPSDGYVDEHEMPGFLIFCSCRFTYAYALRDLPAEMLTTKGRAELSRIREVA
jgi:hypothetical protein